MVEDRIRAALREIVDVPALPAHEKGPWWTRALVAAAAVAAIVAAVALVPTWLPDPAVGVAGAKPSFPERFPSYSWLQGNVDGPFGRAIALYTSGTGHEDFGFWQTLVVGADRNSVRKLDLPKTPNGALVPVRLSPDGTKVVVGGSPGVLTSIDLTTDIRRSYPVADGADTRPLAISADGSSVAYLSVVDGDAFSGPGTVYVLDLVTGQVSAPLGRDDVAAAFSPDGSMLAVQTEDTIRVIRRDGTLLHEVAITSGTRLAGAQAWSPDGYLIATVQPTQGYRFVRALSGELGPATIPADQLPPCAGEGVIGWRSATTVLVSTGDVDGTTSNLITEVDLATGAKRVLSHFEVGPRDDLAVCGVQLAANLVPEMVMRPGTGPDRGRWPTWTIMTLAAGGAVVATLAWWLLRRYRRRIRT